MLQILESLFLQLSRLHLGTRDLQTLRKNVDVPHLYCNQWTTTNPPLSLSIQRDSKNYKLKYHINLTRDDLFGLLSCFVVYCV